MCGQIFCNQCSSYYIDGVRACRLCFDQLSERAERDDKMCRLKASSPYAADIAPADMCNVYTQLHLESASDTVKDEVTQREETDKQFHMNNLQNRASTHFEAIVGQLVSSAKCVGKTLRKEDVKDQSERWKNTIVSLVREVVSSVDPNVRNGDSLDIQPYVKLKIIPGGSIDECVYVDGVVFRKTVSHKKMMVVEVEKRSQYDSGNNRNPRILLLAGGIDFQRADVRLSSLDTLIEQEDRYMEILVEKIMSLKPDVILVGKAVTRRAQELLCQYEVAVMQNVKPHLLERISRMTGAMMLPSTDNHMIQQYGKECLGSCGLFWLRRVMDNPEKIDPDRQKRVLRAPISRGSTYAYLQGCPPELGCTLVLRGANREVLSEVKKIISFCLVVAYHLRLEVAYYGDRFAQLPTERDDEWYGDDSDDDDYAEETASTRNDANSSPYLRRSWRHLLSTSLDVDLRLPYRSELRGLPRSVGLRGLGPLGDGVRTSGPLVGELKRISASDHQTLLVTSMLMGMGEGREGKVQKSRAEIMGIRFYSTRDMAVGQFLIENCFQLHNNINAVAIGGEKKEREKENTMLDQTLSYTHRPGRIDITVHRIG
jgi:uncharacterized protein YaaR (DUF327 family)